MSTEVVLIVAAALFGIGVYGALSQQSFVMLMMGLELMINGAILALVVLWARAAGGSPQGQMLGVVFMTVMAVEMALGFALITGVYRVRRADITEKLRRPKECISSSRRSSRSPAGSACSSSGRARAFPAVPLISGPLHWAGPVELAWWRG